MSERVVNVEPTEKQIEEAWIETIDGCQFFPRSPKPDQIDITAIATVLARLPRFGGHTMFTYSVAQHSVHVAELVQEDRLKLPALLHDACEVYTGFGDIPRPVKRLVPLIVEFERAATWAIANRFGIEQDLFYHPAIKQADNVMLATERRDVKGMSSHRWEAFPEPLPSSQIRIGTHPNPASMVLAMAEHCRVLGGYPPFVATDE